MKSKDENPRPKATPEKLSTENLTMLGNLKRKLKNDEKDERQD